MNLAEPIQFPARYSGVQSNRPLRIAMLGMVEGNGHPFSWSAIINGYDAAAMAQCPYPLITSYLGQQPAGSVGIADVQVTHLWTDSRADAELVARASMISTIVNGPEDVLGEVDAVMIATDVGSEHIERCRPFVEAGIPIFVDKPLVDNEADLMQFCEWVEAGVPIVSSSAMRYCKEYLPFKTSIANLGPLQLATVVVPKSLEQYGIHALEAIYSILGPGFETCRHTGSAGHDIIHFHHRSGAEIVVYVLAKSGSPFAALQLIGTDGHAGAHCADFYYCFRAQIIDFVDFVRTGRRSYPFIETVELMRMLIAALQSRAEHGREIVIHTLGEKSWTF